VKQLRSGGFLVAAVLLTLLLQGTVGLMPAGALAALLVPLPAAYLAMRQGLWAGFAVVLCAALTGFGLAGYSEAVGYLVQFGVPSLLLPWLLKRGIRWDRALALSLLLLLGIGGLFLYGLAARQQVTVPTLVEGYLQGEIETALTLAGNMDLPVSQAAQFEATVRHTGDLLLQVYPAAAAVGYGLLLLTTLLGLVMAGRSCYRIPGRPFEEWKVPELLIWGLIVAGGGVLLADGMVSVVALNLLVVMLPLYFLQGLAIVRYFFRSRRVSPLLRTLGYVLLATLNPLPVLVAGIGVFDLWIDFRKPRNAKD